MNSKKWLRLGAYWTAALSAALAVEPTGPNLAPELRATLDRFRTESAAAWLAGTPDTVSARDAENVRLMPAYQATVLGRAHAAEYRTAFGRRFRVGAFAREPMD